MKVRATAAKVIFQVTEQGYSLSTALPSALQLIAAKDRALLQEICYGTLRWLNRLEFIAEQLIERPLKGKHRSLHYLLLVGLYQLFYTRIPPHAALAETVNATKVMNGDSFRGMINGVLRNAQRQQDELLLAADKNEATRFSYPRWLLKKIKQSCQYGYVSVLQAGNQYPPMWLRMNLSRQSREQYQQQLVDVGINSTAHASCASALLLEKACDVGELPGFSEGSCSVQDAAAQHAAWLLAPQPNELVLDACAAPGGKTAHILEYQPALKQLVAVDFDATRLARVAENLQRITLEATLIHGDASQPERWWQGPQFDRILLDAPCSATGVIRRHPDIKWLRKAEDITELARLQSTILDAMWLQLKPGGTLLYATCSILSDENSDQIKAFIERTIDVIHVPLHEQDTIQKPGWQIYPGEQQMDGFFYAKLMKQVTA
jgi:16S rRNA (cytosine967-C5)-methyltransferase